MLRDQYEGSPTIGTGASASSGEDLAEAAVLWHGLRRLMLCFWHPGVQQVGQLVVFGFAVRVSRRCLQQLRAQTACLWPNLVGTPCALSLTRIFALLQI